METKAVAAQKRAFGSRDVLDFILRYGIYFAFLILVTAMSFLSPNFLTVGNVTNVLLQSSVIGVIAVGMTFIIITRGIDVSVGSVVAVSSAVAVALMLFRGANQYVGVLMMLASGVLAGLFNGFAVANCVVGRAPLC